MKPLNLIDVIARSVLVLRDEAISSLTEGT